MKLLRTALLTVWLAGWATMMVSWGSAAFLERTALHQLDYRNGEYTEPLSLKGAIRYVTPEQKRWYEAAKTAFMAGFVIGSPAIIILLAWDRRRARKTMDRLLHYP